jgi:integrase
MDPPDAIVSGPPEDALEPKCARIGKNDRPAIDPLSIQDAEVLIAAIHQDWGEAQGSYDELRFFTGLRPSEEIALVVTDYDAAHGLLSITKARVLGIDKDVTKTGEDRRIRLAHAPSRSSSVSSDCESGWLARGASITIACSSRTRADRSPI